MELIILHSKRSNKRNGQNSTERDFFFEEPKLIISLFLDLHSVLVDNKHTNVDDPEKMMMLTEREKNEN